MPKTKLTDLSEKRLVASTVITKKMALQRVGDDGIAAKLHCTDRTVRNRWKKPDYLRLGELWVLVTTLGLTDEEIIQIARGKVDVRQHMDRT